MSVLQELVAVCYSTTPVQSEAIERSLKFTIVEVGIRDLIEMHFHRYNEAHFIHGRIHFYRYKEA